MIFSFLFLIIVASLSFVLEPFDVVTELPWGIDGFMVSGVSGFKLLAEFFPPFATVLNAFLIYMGFRLSMIILKFFLGSRTPSHL